MKTPTIGIIGGKGRMGALFAEFFRNAGVKVQVADIKTKLTNISLAKNSDIIIISVPIDKTERVINEVLPWLKSTQAIMDFTSVKEMPIKAMLKGDCEVFGMHPMFGNSNPIPGQTVILCSTKKSSNWSRWMEEFLSKNSVNLINMSAKEHDKVMNISQGLIHFSEIAFADALRRTNLPTKDLLKFASKASELKVLLAARIIDQDAGLYGNIQMQNANSLKSLKDYKKSVEELIKIVEKKDLKGFISYFDKCKRFYKSYTKEAYNVSSALIDRFIELEKKETKESAKTKPRKHDLALLGPKNTYSDVAATEYLLKRNKDNNKFYTKRIDEVFELVESGKVEFGLIPIENKLGGTIRETLDNLFQKNVHIKCETQLAIHHCLIALAHSKKTDIKKIISHEQALKQCEKYLRKNFPKAELEAVNSTTAAIEKLASKNDRGIAAIATKIAAEGGEFKILAEHIEDKSNNATTFIVIEKGECTLSKHSSKSSEPVDPNLINKTSIAFHFNEDSPGSLFTVFKDFADAKVNMTKIESRPTQKKFGDYIFYLDFEGSIYSSKIANLLQKISKKVAKLKILGSY